MNKFEGVGNLTRDVETRELTGDNPTTMARFGVALPRKYKNAEGKYDADFINCVAFGSTATFISKYFSKGMRIGICGRVQSGSYTNQEGAKVYTTDIVVEEAEFCDSKAASEENKKKNADDGFMNIPDALDDELPFN